MWESSPELVYFQDDCSDTAAHPPSHALREEISSISPSADFPITSKSYAAKDDNRPHCYHAQRAEEASYRQ